MGLPPKLLAKGVTDMVRISDARMSGTAYGTVVLHVCPEAASGGPLALIEDGDMIELDVEARRITSKSQMKNSVAARSLDSASPRATSGYQHLYIKHVMEASEAPTWTSW